LSVDKNIYGFEREAIVNGKMGKDYNDYQRMLTDVFSECYRVLKSKGKLIFTFHHSRIDAWYRIAKSLMDSGFYVDDYFPARTEYKVNPHIRNKKAKDTDLVLFCNKSKRNDVGDIIDIVGSNLVNRGIIISILKNLCDVETITRGELLRIITKHTTRDTLSFDYFEKVHNEILDIISNDLEKENTLDQINNIVGVVRKQSLITSYK